jgi:ribosomal-protein-alanine N-acetyltransferase
MAAERALVATSSGVAGLGLRHLESAWIADDAEGLARGIVELTLQPELRARLAGAARQRAVAEFGWPALAEKQARVWRELLTPGSTIEVRPMAEADLDAVSRIQGAQPLAAQWTPADYLGHRAFVAEVGGRLAGFLAARAVSSEEMEILNVAVDPAFARRGIGARLLRHALLGPERSVFLEVRESNLAARSLYSRHGFVASGRRKSYYRDPQEDGIVMNLQKW